MGREGTLFSRELIQVLGVPGIFFRKRNFFFRIHLLVLCPASWRNTSALVSERLLLSLSGFFCKSFSLNFRVN